VFNMFRTLIYPSSGACDFSVELPHWSYCSWFDMCWSLCCASACNTDATPTQPHRNSNTDRTKNNMTNVVIQQNSHKFLMMDILMSETCWAHKKWNKIASDIKLVIYSSTIGVCVCVCVCSAKIMPGMPQKNLRIQQNLQVETSIEGEWELLKGAGEQNKGKLQWM